MKNEAIVKINKMGKIGLVISRIWFIFVCLGLVGCMIGLVTIAFLPNDFVQMDMNGSAEMRINIPEAWLDDAETPADDALKASLPGKITVGDDGASVVLTEANVDGNTLRMSGSGELYSLDFGKVKLAITFAIISVIFFGITALFACRLCKSIRDCDTPFEDKVIKNIQLVAYSLIPWCLVDSISNVVPGILFHTGSAGFSINISTLLICLIILAIAYIFKYGAKLQQEADETL